MDQPYNWMFSEWLPASGMVPADFPMFEQYLNDPRSTPPRSCRRASACR